MTASWLAVGLLAGAAVVTTWPARRSRVRHRLIIGCPRASSPRVTASITASRMTASAAAPGAEPGLRRFLDSARSHALSSPRRTALLSAGITAGLGAAAAGPVAAVVAGAYGGLAVRTLLRRESAHNASRERVRQLDSLCALAADLRAGLPVPAAASAVAQLGALPVAMSARSDEASPPTRVAVTGRPGAVAGGSGLAVAAADRSGSAAAAAGRPVAATGRLVALTQAAFGLAERTGAPLADLVERIEADARAMDRASAGAAAQAAGARATAWLLAALPLGGVALGYGIGVDPLAVLLHTPIGAGCAVAAVVLQFAGLAWADRLSGSASRTI